MPHGNHASAIGIGLAVAAVAAVYVLGLRRLGARSHGLPAWRVASFLLGVALIWIAVGSPLASSDAGSLTGHMVQHLLLMTLAPPLMLLGEPVRVMRVRLPRLRQAIEHRFLGRTSLRAAVACWLAGRECSWLWHVPAVFALALHSHAWHAIEQASFLVAGLLFWWPVIEPWPGRPLPLLVDRPLPLPGDAAVRHPLGFPGVLGPDRLCRLPVGGTPPLPSSPTSSARAP